MDYKKLADLLFPNIDKTPDYYENLYPKRDLPSNAKVTRLGPSPTGFIHLGNLYGAFVDERLAHQSGGIFFLRIEDTDEKRRVEGATEVIISSLDFFGVSFDEGATSKGDIGAYGPYIQSERSEIYQTFAKQMILNGQAYPCFCTENEMNEIRKNQEDLKVNPGYYGQWAKYRNATLSEIEEKLLNNQEFVIRLRSQGKDGAPDFPAKTFTVEDGIRGSLTMPENFHDIVLLKSSGIPTYHFAHVVDDYLMRTTHVVRGEEWLSSLPVHVELFNTLNLPLPIYCHTAQLMKIDDEEGTKRKLSKRKDPELSLDYYREKGYHPAAVREYLLTVLNSNFEEWRIANPDQDLESFEFTTEKMSNSGALFDLNKLNDVSKDVLAKIDAKDLADFLVSWAKAYKPELNPIINVDYDYLSKILNIGRTDSKPRKDLIFAEQIFEFISYFFDEYFAVTDSYPENVVESDQKSILSAYLATYNHSDNQSEWFDKIRILGSDLGYAAKPKDYKKNPDLYKGHVGDVSTVIRIALTGRASSPDIWEIQQIMGETMVKNRIINSFQD